MSQIEKIYILTNQASMSIVNQNMTEDMFLKNDMVAILNLVNNKLSYAFVLLGGAT